MLDLDYRRYKAVREAAENTEDSDAMDSLVDSLREMHTALHPGETVDWVAAINRDDDPQ